MSLKKFYADPYYNIRSFALQATIAAALCVVLFYARTAYGFTFSWWQPLIYGALGIYLGGLSCVWIHNATHRSFRSPILNELCGYLAGLHQLWGLNGWRLIHLVHHQYSDDIVQDPHPPRGRSFAQFLRAMAAESSFTISRRYRAQWGDTPRTRILQRMVFAALFVAALLTLVMWFLLLGPVAFVFGYIPSLLWNHVMFAHINYYCHPADATGATAAANLNHALYYKIANALWHGIYFHGNHHKKPILFNPRHMDATSVTATATESLKEVA